MPFKKIAFLEFTNKLPPRRALFQKQLEEMGYETATISWNRSRPPKPATKNSFEVLLPAGYHSPNLLLLIPYVWKNQLKYLQTYDPYIVIAGHYFLLPVAIYWRFFKGWRNKKIFYDAIEHYPEHFSIYMKFFRKLFLFLFTQIENLMAACCSGVMCVDSCNDYMERRLKKWNHNVISIWNVPSVKDDPRDSDFENTGRIIKGKTAIAFVGGASLEKGVSTAIQAAAIVARKRDNLAFLFIGPFMNTEKILKKMVRDLEANKYIHFLGNLPYRQMMAYLKQSRLGIALHQNHPYYNKLSAGNGRKFFSYMQAGLPIIGPSHGEIGRAIDLADCGTLVDTSDATIVANTIMYYLDNPEEAARLGNNGLWAFKTHFNWESEAFQFKRFVKANF